MISGITSSVSSSTYSKESKYLFGKFLTESLFLFIQKRSRLVFWNATAVPAAIVEKLGWLSSFVDSW